MQPLGSQKLTPAERRLFERFRASYRAQQKHVRRTTRILEEKLRQMEESRKGKGL